MDVITLVPFPSTILSGYLPTYFYIISDKIKISCSLSTLKILMAM